MTGAVVILAVLGLGVTQQEAVPVPTPASVVAEHVRSALSNPKESMNWDVLEASVQEMESVGRGTSSLSWSRALDSPRYWASEIVEAAGTKIALGSTLLVTLLVGGGIMFGWMQWRRRSPSLESATAPVDIFSGRAWTATVLSGQGLSRIEIARRTGMARDAVSLALTTQGASPSRFDSKQGRVA